MFFSRYKTNNVYPYKSQFYYIKVGFMGSKVHRHVFVMVDSEGASTQSDQGLNSPLTESLDTTECMNGEQRPGFYFSRAHDNLNRCFLRMFESTFPLDSAHFDQANDFRCVFSHPASS